MAAGPPEHRREKYGRRACLYYTAFFPKLNARVEFSIPVYFAISWLRWELIGDSDQPLFLQDMKPPSLDLNHLQIGFSLSFKSTQEWAYNPAVKM